ncbi:MAG: pyruvate kinase [Elusimicrobiota bacterium]|jgi:pyruvate kinase|nr:pyruvate kinase [Elusimicrobiota bacterium]
MKNINHYCKIVATIGLLDGREDLIEKLYLAGATVFRMNLSHSSVADNAKKIKIIRSIEKKYNCSLGVIFDLQGPKLRVGIFKDGEVLLKEGQTFQLDLDATPGDNTRVNLPHKEIYEAVEKDHILLFNDGLIRVRVESVSKDKIITTVLNGGPLSNHKGVNVPDAHLAISALTERDIENIKEANELDVDWFALSFVQKPEDVLLARSLIKSKAGIISKIEKPLAFEHIDKIVEYSDVVMVARGDLGVEVSPEKVPVMQRKIIVSCRRAGKPVIVATQMLESMINNPAPTRAEASDVATAVYEGVDAVMLSGETASGKYPVEAVSTMRRIINNVEADDKHMLRPESDKKDTDVSYAITAAAGITAELIDTADVIVNFTNSGMTTFRTAQNRPCLPILSLTPHIEVARKMAVVWGVQAYQINKDLEKFEDIEQEVRENVQKLGLAKKGSKVVVTAGIPFGETGDTNLLYVITL